MESGIYKISFIGSEKFYIGSAKKLNARKAAHLTKMKSGVHFNKIMQNCFNKYGLFLFEVLERCEVDKLIEREQFYFDTLNPTINILKKAANSLGYKHTPETIELLKVKNKEIANRKSVKEKVSKTYFKKGQKMPHTKEHIRNRVKAYTGYKHREESRIKMSISAQKKDMSKIDISKWVLAGKEHSKKPVCQYDLRGNLINTFSSITEAVAQFNTKQTRHIVNCCNGRKEKYKGYKWEFATKKQGYGK